MATKIYGELDDLVEIDGDVIGEIGCYGTTDGERGVLIVCSDGTLVEAKYGKGGVGIWTIQLLQKGTLFQEIVPCLDEDADPHSDVAMFADGLKWAYAAGEWEKVQEL